MLAQAAFDPRLQLVEALFASAQRLQREIDIERRVVACSETPTEPAVLQREVGGSHTGGLQRAVAAQGRPATLELPLQLRGAGLRPALRRQRAGQRGQRPQRGQRWQPGLDLPTILRRFAGPAAIDVEFVASRGRAGLQRHRAAIAAQVQPRAEWHARQQAVVEIHLRLAAQPGQGLAEVALKLLGERGRQLRLDLPAAVGAMRPARPRGARRSGPPGQRIEARQLTRALQLPAALAADARAAGLERGRGPCIARGGDQAHQLHRVSGQREVELGAQRLRGTLQQRALQRAVDARRPRHWCGGCAGRRGRQRHAAQLDRRRAADAHRAGLAVQARRFDAAQLQLQPQIGRAPLSAAGDAAGVGAVVGELRFEALDVDAIELLRRGTQLDPQFAHRHAVVVEPAGLVVAQVHQRARRFVEARRLHVGLRIDPGARCRTAQRAEVERAGRQLELRQRPGFERPDARGGIERRRARVAHVAAQRGAQREVGQRAFGVDLGLPRRAADRAGLQLQCQRHRRVAADAPVGTDLHTVVAQRQAADAVLRAVGLAQGHIGTHVAPWSLVVELQLIHLQRRDAQRERQAQLAQRTARRPARARRAPHHAPRLQ